MIVNSPGVDMPAR
jgi:hypothetical protein